MTMKIRGRHHWRYRSTWHETKTGPGRWTFTSPQTKTRIRPVRGMHGTRPGTTFLWRIRATQRMTKKGPNTYHGRMTGTKHLISRRRRY